MAINSFMSNLLVLQKPVDWFLCQGIGFNWREIQPQVHKKACGSIKDHEYNPRFQSTARLSLIVRSQDTRRTFVNRKFFSTLNVQFYHRSCGRSKQLQLQLQEMLAPSQNFSLTVLKLLDTHYFLPAALKWLLMYQKHDGGKLEMYNATLGRPFPVYQ